MRSDINFLNIVLIEYVKPISQVAGLLITVISIRTVAENCLVVYPPLILSMQLINHSVSEEAELAPGEMTEEGFRDLMYMQTMKSLTDPGEAVGLLAAQVCH